MPKKKSISTAKKIKDNVFKSEDTTDVFGDKVTKHELLAEGAEVQKVEAISDTKLESDLGTGREVILRMFEFAVNPEIFKDRKPTSQEIFNSHLRGINGILWGDGLKPAEDIEPRLIFSKGGKSYRIFIACNPTMGNILVEKTQTLSEIANGSRKN